MRIRQSRRWLTIAALAIAPVLAPRVASAQYLSQNNSGHAMDANSLVGSGGYNGAINNVGQPSQNDIIFGNVTGGRGFHGKVDSFGSDAFQGSIAGRNTDAFVAGSSGAPTPYSPTFNSYTPRAFYGESRGVNPPPGTILLGSSGAAIGTSLTPANPYSAIATPDQLADIRVGQTNVIGYSGANTNFLAVPGASANSSLPNIQASMTNAPLNAPGAANGGQLNAASLNDLLNNPAPGTLAPGSLDPNAIAALQSTITATSANAFTPPTSEANPNNPNGTENPTPAPVNPYNLGGPSPLLPQTGGTNNGRVNGALKNAPLEMPVGSPLGATSSRLNDQVQSTPLNTYSESPNGVQLVSPQTYSQQYGDMVRLERQYNPQSPSRPVRNGAKPRTIVPTTQPGGLTLPGSTPGAIPGSTPGTPATPGLIPGQTPGGVPPVSVPGQAKSGEKAAGVRISSIAGTVTSPRAKGLHDLLAKADDALKSDHFKDAIGLYEGAARVAPNNQMITLGLANADLAGGYYAAAETNIRRAFANSAPVLMAKQDLSSMISASRLDFLNKDLKELAYKNPKLSRPWFLLAYVAYNTGHEQEAADDLKQAQKLSGEIDPAIRLMQTYWQLPDASGGQSSPSLNK